MLKRHIDSVLDNHYASTRKALLLTGARQTGKTYAIRAFAQRAGLQLVELNFILQPETRLIPQGAANVQDLLLRISAYANKPLEPGKTLIFFDEVQDYPDIMTWVKALVDDGRFRFALSGSLLGVELQNIRSVPVGYMDEYPMFPLDFEEFIRNIGVTDEVIDSIRASWEQQTPVDAYIHEKILRLFNLYLIVGGMPAVVQKYIERPLLYYGRKFDIRIWVLLTHDFKVYMFNEGHLKCCSVKYDLDACDSFSHLTNYSFQKHNNNFGKYEKGNEVSFDDLQYNIQVNYNNKVDFKTEIIPKIKHIITLI